MSSGWTTTCPLCGRSVVMLDDRGVDPKPRPHDCPSATPVRCPPSAGVGTDGHLSPLAPLAFPSGPRAATEPVPQRSGAAGVLSKAVLS